MRETIHIYPQPNSLSDRLFAETHPKSEKLNPPEITAKCRDFTCICHRICVEILQISGLHISENQWQTEILQLSGINLQNLQEQLQQRPFAIVHRSLRDLFLLRTWECLIEFSNRFFYLVAHQYSDLRRYLNS